jgi:DNA-binding Lrp family transcriptional regulator
MSKLDDTDLEIITRLDNNARQTNSEIAKKLNLSKNVVNYRIKNLEKNGVIKGYSSWIDFFSLGYQSFRVYLKLQRANTITENKIMYYLGNSPFSWWCSHARGRFDICSVFWFNAPMQFFNMWDGFRKEYKSYIKEASVVPYCGVLNLGLTLSDIPENRRNAVIGSCGLQKIDNKDKAILQALSYDSRMPLSSIAKAVKLTSAAIKYRIDQLLEKKIITAFMPLVDMGKLGYTNYKIDLNLNSLKNKEKIEQYLLKKPNVSQLIRTAGWADIELRAYVKRPAQLYSLLDEIRDEFSHQLLDYSFFEYPLTVKKSYMPDF